jgi:hypothetical protein
MPTFAGSPGTSWANPGMAVIKTVAIMLALIFKRIAPAVLRHPGSRIEI